MPLGEADPPLERLAEHFRGDPFVRALGMELLELKPGYSKMAMTVREDMLSFHGIPHGGAIFSLADSAFAAASNSRGQQAVALDVSISFVSTTPVGTRLVAEASEENLGRRTALYHITVSTEDGTLVASSHGTVYRRGEPAEGRQ